MLIEGQDVKSLLSNILDFLSLKSYLEVHPHATEVKDLLLPRIHRRHHKFDTTVIPTKPPVRYLAFPPNFRYLTGA